LGRQETLCGVKKKAGRRPREVGYPRDRLLLERLARGEERRGKKKKKRGRQGGHSGWCRKELKVAACKGGGEKGCDTGWGEQRKQRDVSQTHWGEGGRDVERKSHYRLQERNDEKTTVQPKVKKGRKKERWRSSSDGQ